MLGYPDVITKQGLKGLKKYKYSSVDLSPISNYILQPYWSWAVTLFPMWMAPNLITFLGFIIIMINFGILLIYCPTLDVEGPTWMYWSFALGLWLYSTFDNVDGKQARRTNSSSPLGELFDHGIDALNCTLAALLQAGAMLSGSGTGGFIPVALANIIFFFFTWETYYTGTLYLGYMNGPTEGLLSAIAAIISSALYGPQFWKNHIGHYYQTPFSWINNMECQFFLLSGFCALGAITQVPGCISRSLAACKMKKRSQTKALLTILPFAIFCAAVSIWAYAPDSTIFPDNTILFLLAAGFTCARINALMVLQHVTHMEFPSYTLHTLPFVLGAFITTLPQTVGKKVFSASTERSYVILVLSFVIVDYIFWATKVVEQFCNHLKIHCFKIPLIISNRKSTKQKQL